MSPRKSSRWREVPVKVPKLATSLSAAEKCDALDKSAIVELSATLIDKMTCDELIRMIRVSELPSMRGPELQQRLEFQDRDTLVRIAHLARRYCQSQGNGHRTPTAIS